MSPTVVRAPVDVADLTALLRAKADEFQRLAVVFAAQTPSPIRPGADADRTQPLPDGATHA